MVSILDWKDGMKELHLSLVNELEILSPGLRSLFMVVKTDFW